MDNNLPDLTANGTIQDGHSNLEKLTQSYLLLKQKICETHEVIKQYNDKLKECERLKTDLDAATKQTKKVSCNYNSTLAKVIKLELQNTEYKKNIETLKAQVNEYQIKLAADQQHIQQLICKIKDVEEQQNDKIMQYDLEKSSLQVKIKEVEQELKNVKKSYDTKIKKMEKKISMENSSNNNTRVKMKDAGINTIFANDDIVLKPKVAHKCIMTNEFYDVNDMYPIFCAKCEVHLKPAPLEKICKIMVESCPRLIEKISSPKKALPSLEISNDLDNEHYATESLPILSETQLPHLQDQNNHVDLIPTKLLPLHNPVALNRADYCHNLPQKPNYYIGSIPVNSPSMTSSSTSDQNNHCEDITTVSSSLSLISSLQKRIDMLETKIKQKFNKRKSEQSGNCWQHKYPNVCMYNSNCMQLNFMELWKRMADFYDTKEKDRFNMHKYRNKNSSKCKASLIKRKKRLQSGCAGSWNVETVPKKVQQTPLRRRLKKRKYQHSMLLSKSNSLLSKHKDFEKSISDSDTNSYDNAFNDGTHINASVSMESKNVSPVEKSILRSNCNSRLKTSCSIQYTDTDEADEIEEAIQNSVETSKFVGGETDSGILSDSVESAKQLETGISTRSSSKKRKTMPEVKPFTKNASSFTENVEPRKLHFAKKSPVKAIKSSKLMETSIDPEILKLDEHTEKTENKRETESSTFNSTSCTRKRKLRTNEHQEPKKCGSRQVLLKKLRNLKKTSKIIKTSQNVSDHQRVEQNHLANEKETVNDDNCVPTKRPRIAHVPKSTVIEQTNSIHNSPQVRKCQVKDVTNINVQPQTVAGNNSEIDINTTAEETKVVKTKCREYNAPILKMVKDDDNELEKKCSNKREEIKSNFVNTVNSITTNVIDKNNVDELVSTDADHSSENNSKIKDPLDIDVDSGLSEMKIESKEEYEGSKQECENNSPTSNEIITEVDNNGSMELNSNESQVTENADVPQINLDTSNTCIEEVVKIEHSYDSSDLNTSFESMTHCPLVKLKQYINESKILRKDSRNGPKRFFNVRIVTDKFVKKQLQRLTDSDWDTSTHLDVLEKLKSTCSPRIIAKGIVDFLSTTEECNKSLDNTHTPPAPLMTTTQQKIVALLIDLEESKPVIFEFVQAGIEYKLFRIHDKNNGQSQWSSVVQSLSRMYTVLARVKKDREKVRIFCCDILYFLGLHATVALYTVFTCWPEVFPNNDTTNELLPKCIAHLITAQQAAKLPKLNALKNLVSVFYKYKMGTASKDVLKELLTSLQEKSHVEAETAIILLAKREGPKWAYKNIIKSALLPMIIENKLPNTYRAFCLLGNLMRVLPVQDNNNLVGRIVEQLCDLSKSGEGSDEQQEGVISALLSLSRHKFDDVAKSVINWTPIAPLRVRTSIQIDSFFNLRPPNYWKGYLKKCKNLPEPCEQCKT
ncbi:uncharacterized protein LOC128888946 [Hylaeus anthracinus]|uniref:uncharacterized protein LOC128888946 n=1 Tax=Hylaeus anthracinus TaxID=313031 RepID=UPI0023B9AC54|nr:uncharacterized protein LOC128888946 [Hylaeus anthracinus]